MGKVKVMITNNQTEIKIPVGIRLLVRKCCHAVTEYEGFNEDFEVSVSFVDDKQIHELNKEHRNIDRPTDVLSFPAFTDEGFEVNPENDAIILGDIVISLEKAKAQSEEYGHSMKRETAFLIAHSLFHLLGYDHETPDEEKEMFGKQEKVLQRLGITR